MDLPSEETWTVDLHPGTWNLNRDLMIYMMKVPVLGWSSKAVAWSREAENQNLRIEIRSGVGHITYIETGVARCQTRIQVTRPDDGVDIPDQVINAEKARVLAARKEFLVDAFWMDGALNISWGHVQYDEHRRLKQDIYVAAYDGDLEAWTTLWEKLKRFKSADMARALNDSTPLLSPLCEEIAAKAVTDIPGWNGDISTKVLTWVQNGMVDAQASDPLARSRRAILEHVIREGGLTRERVLRACKKDKLLMSFHRETEPNDDWTRIDWVWACTFLHKAIATHWDISRRSLNDNFLNFL